MLKTGTAAHVVVSLMCAIGLVMGLSVQPATYAYAAGAEADAASGEVAYATQNGNVWEVAGGAQLEKAVKEIAASSYTEATILLKCNVGNGTQTGYAPFVGVPGKRVTVKSDSTQVRYSITLGSNMVGDVVFDNVWVVGAVVCANGHHFEMTENCAADNGTQSHFGMLFGGSNPYSDEGAQSGGVAKTNLVLKGNVRFVYVAGGGYFSNVTGSTNVEIGGKTYVDILCGGGISKPLDVSAYPSVDSGASTRTADSSLGCVGGSTSVRVEGNAQIGQIFGGSLEGCVKGSTNITIDGAGVRVQEVYGGGIAQKTKGGTVGGNVNTTVLQGEIGKKFVAGGCNWSGGNERAAAKVTGAAQSVFGGGSGTVKVLSGYAYPHDSSSDKSSYFMGGSFHSTVGSVSLRLLQGTQVAKGVDINGCGVSDTVSKTVDIEVKDAALDGNAIAAGSKFVHDSVTNKAIRVANSGKRANAIHVSYDTENVSAALASSNIYVGRAEMSVMGNALVELKGGRVGMIYLGSHDEGNATTVMGDATALVKGGSVAGIWGRNLSLSGSSTKKAVFDGCGTMASPQQTGYLDSLDDIMLKNNAYVCVSPSMYADEKVSPFGSVGRLDIATGCRLVAESKGSAAIVANSLSVQGEWIAKAPTLINGNVSVSSGSLTFLSSATVKGTWSASNATLKLPVVTNSTIPLKIEGSVSGTTKVVVTNAAGTQEQKPKVGDNYILAPKSVSSQAFTLANADVSAGEGQKLQIGQVTDPASTERSMWQIASVATDGSSAGSGSGSGTGTGSGDGSGAGSGGSGSGSGAGSGAGTGSGAGVGSGSTTTPGAGEPTDPGTQPDPVDPSDPDNPTDPTDPEAPDSPDQPADPASPETPGGIVSPGTPVPGDASGASAAGKTSLAKAQIAVKAQVFTGKKATTKSIVVKHGKRTLRQGVDYRVSGVIGKKVGSYKVTVTGIGAYTGSRTAIVKVVPQGTSISKLKKAKRGFTLSWKKLTAAQAKQITGYQVRWSTSKTMKGAKAKTVKASSWQGKLRTLKVSKLKGNKKYYVQVRTYTKVGKATYYSTWSKAKVVKTKR